MNVKNFFNFEDVYFDIPKYAFSNEYSNAFGDDKTIIDEFYSSEITKLLVTNLNTIDSQTINYTFPKSGYYEILFVCNNKEQTGYMPVCHNYNMNISNNYSTYYEIDEKAPIYSPESGDYEKIYLRITEKQVGQTISIKVISEKSPDKPWKDLGQNIKLIISAKETNVENKGIENSFKTMK